MGFLRRPGGPTGSVAPWAGAGAGAEFAVLPAGRRREVPSVVLTTGGVRVPLHVGEVRDLVRGCTGTAESTAPPLAFLCRPGAAAAGSVVHEVVAHLAGDVLAPVVVVDRPAVAAVLGGAELASFTGWVDGPPRLTGLVGA